MTTDDETKSKRTRRAEPITRRNAKNGAVTYTFQVDIGARPDGSRERQRFTFPTLAEARREYRESRLRSRQEHSSRETERP
jgi:hypothetical protein